MELEGKNVLVCDDQGVVRKVLSSLLLTLGAREINSFINPMDAIAIVNFDDVDLIITDIEMPEMNGLEFSGWLFVNGFDNIPLIVMSGSINIDRISREVYQKCSFLEKPFMAQEIREAIKIY